MVEPVEEPDMSELVEEALVVTVVLVSAEKAAKNGVRGIAALIASEMQLLTEDKPIPALKLVPAEPTVEKEKRKTIQARSLPPDGSICDKPAPDTGDVMFYVMLKKPEYAVR